MHLLSAFCPPAAPVHHRQVDTAVTFRASLRGSPGAFLHSPASSITPIHSPTFLSPLLLLLASLPAGITAQCGLPAPPGLFHHVWTAFGVYPPPPLARSFSLSLSLSLSLCRPHPSSLFSFLPSSVRVLLLPSPSFTHLHPSSASIPYRSLFPFSASQRRCDSHVAAAGRTACAGAGGRRSCIFPALGRCVFGTFGIRTSGASLCQAPAAAPRAATVGRSYNTP